MSAWMRILLFSLLTCCCSANSLITVSLLIHRRCCWRDCCCFGLISYLVVTMVTLLFFFLVLLPLLSDIWTQSGVSLNWLSSSAVAVVALTVILLIVGKDLLILLAPRFLSGFYLVLCQDCYHIFFYLDGAGLFSWFACFHVVAPELLTVSFIGIILSRCFSCIS